MTQITTTPPVSVPAASPAMPSTLKLGLSRAAAETRMFFRQRDAVIFTFSFPIILLAIFGSIFSDGLEGTGLTVSQLYVAGLIGSATMTGFQNLGIGIAMDRDDGTLRRLAAPRCRPSPTSRARRSTPCSSPPSRSRSCWPSGWRCSTWTCPRPSPTG
nr:hypothetical protein GCM10020093_097790 [Planobispora longispora]